MGRLVVAILVVMLLSGAITTVLGSTDPPEGDPCRNPVPVRDDVADTISRYLDGLDPSHPPMRLGKTDPDPVPPKDPSLLPMASTTGVVLLFDDTSKEEWVPVPTMQDLSTGRVEPVTVINGSDIELHGKLYSVPTDPNLTYLDDVGIPEVPIEVSFDGVSVTAGMGIVTGDATSVIDPFVGTGNGTFNVVFEVTRPAGSYEVKVDFAGWPPGENTYPPVRYNAILYVQHPTVVTMDASPGTVVVGEPLNVTGSLADDTGRPITNIPVQVWLDEQLVGPSSPGVYIDDFQVKNASVTNNFEGSSLGWFAYSVPGMPAGNQWQHGVPVPGHGPPTAHSGSKAWGTVLDGNYQRGAWSFLVSEPVNMTKSLNYSLTFWAWWDLRWSEDMVYVLYSTDEGASWSDDSPWKFTGGLLTSSMWRWVELDARCCSGADRVMFAFVFYSVDKTVDARTDSTFAYRYYLPMETTADVHKVTVRFKGNLLFAGGEESEAVTVQRKTHFEFESNMSRKVGHRNNLVHIQARLVDNMGEVPKTIMRGQKYTYPVTIYWDSTWTVKDGLGDAVGPPIAMDNGTGEVEADHVVAHDHILGPVNVTFKFQGSDFYAASQEADIYYIKAETYFLAPPVQERRFFRGQDAVITVDLRIVIDQSLDKLEPGDPITGEFVKIFWNHNQLGNRRTGFDGSLTIIYLVPSTHGLGEIPITFVYEGQSLYEPVTLVVNYTVVSRTTISMDDQVVHKGEWVWINGTIKDDKGVPLEGVPVGLTWRGPPGIATVVSGPKGVFSYQYFIEFEDKVGNVSVTASFGGVGYNLPCQTTVTFTVKVGTILERRDGVYEATRGDTIQVTAKLCEDWDGLRAVEVQREIVYLLIDDMVVSFKRTAFDGSVRFTAPLDSEKYRWGDVDLVFEFRGTDYYEPSSNRTVLTIHLTTMVTISEVTVNELTFNPEQGFVTRADVFRGRVLVMDDDFQPLPFWNVSILSRTDRDPSRPKLLSYGRTDPQGYYEFHWAFSEPFSCYIEILCECDGLANGVERVFGFDYVIPPDEPERNVMVTAGDSLVRPGEPLLLRVGPERPNEWDSENLRYFLISAPEGMSITDDGTLVWIPTEDQMGRHEVVVWLFDGQTSKSATVMVNVSEDPVNAGDWTILLVLILVGLSVVVVIVIILTIRKRE